MKKYFLHNGTESSGPFDLAELKTKKISKTTPVWFEGMEKWLAAGAIKELESIFVVSPPTVSSYALPTPKPTGEEKKEIASQKILGLPKNTFYIGIGVLFILIGNFIFNTIQENRSKKLEIMNHKTEVENYQYELEQKKIEEQKLIDLEIEKVIAERTTKENKNAKKNSLNEINNKITEYQNQLSKTEKKISDASDFKLLRSSAEKKEQINLLQKDIDSFKSEIEQLKKDSNQLKLDLEKSK